MYCLTFELLAFENQETITHALILVFFMKGYVMRYRS